MDKQVFSAKQYETKYKQGYGLVYPESHIIRVHRHILEWELGMRDGTIFDFGCGSGAHLKYFADHGFVPYGCDVSKTAIEQCAKMMPEHVANFFVTPAVKPDLAALVGPTRFNVFLSNQVLYYLDDEGIRDIVRQAHAMLQTRGVFVVSMMAYSCWYARFITGTVGDLKKVDMKTPRQTETMFINFKNREEIEALFKPFRKLHLGSYGNHIRDEEGSTDHWLYVGVRD
jgi:2-polyprenyl-3-methyl-5-hydroxy-6-metoxy-1,4-benzoquinol methylase